MHLDLRANPPHSPWEVFGIVDRFTELHAEKFSFSQMASMLSAEFNVKISRNAAIGKSNRLSLPKREAVGFNKVNRERRTEKRKRVRVVLERDPADGQRIADVAPQHISFDGLTAGNCHYPYGEGPFTFCGCEAVHGLSYCAGHQHLTNNSAHIMSRAQYRLHKRRYASKLQAEVVAA